MANLSIRKLDETVYHQLQVRAAQHHISMEEEVRRIIYQAVATPGRIGDIFTKNFGAHGGIELNIPNQRTPHEPLDFQE